jgi:hypothetical protein
MLSMDIRVGESFINRDFTHFLGFSKLAGVFTTQTIVIKKLSIEELKT